MFKASQLFSLAHLAYSATYFPLL